jgi:hypothetical protein
MLQPGWCGGSLEPTGRTAGFLSLKAFGLRKEKKKKKNFISVPPQIIRAKFYYL